MKICVIGTGYVGLVTGTCFAETGNDVTCVDTDKSKIDRLQKGEVPFYEPGLGELVTRNVGEGRLRFSTAVDSGISEAVISFICVGTPSSSDGSADLKAVEAVAEQVGKAAPKGAVLVLKSTVPVGTAEECTKILNSMKRADIHVVSNPEFLREGTAVQDCLIPDRIVIGTLDMAVSALLRELYSPFVRTGHPVFAMDHKSAELTKYAANALLALRISFMNEISMICEKEGADIANVREAIGADHRIGPQYLFPSVGFGGSCFPKDVRALTAHAREIDVEPRLLQATLDVNEAQKQAFVGRVLRHFGGEASAKGKRVAIWGLAFKAKTDDIRESPALTVIDGLLAAGMKLHVFDPVANANAKVVYGDRLTYASSTYGALEGAAALCVLTEWNQFRHPDFGKIKSTLASPVIFDGRNLYDPQALKKLGFTYYSIGRPPASN
ncbi:MAG TPA: UDP-glucose/GDP-mannose dehydrogenase family protein [Bdellovibrionota bacterium]|nr:UDP-glucose/GDP-mannose dehydrogenase family protein [Bdellovibrionota bacterium]